MNSSFANQLNAFNRDVMKLIPDEESKAKITKAGADVFKQKLAKVTPKSNKKHEKYGHLRDNLLSQNSDIDGKKNGKSVVGFGEKAYIARFLNDGTVKMRGNHFVDNARREAANDVFKAQENEYHRLTGGKHD